MHGCSRILCQLDYISRSCFFQIKSNMRDKIYEIEYNCCNSLFVPEENSRCPKCRKEGPRTKILSVHTSTVAISNPKSFCFKPTFGSFDNYDNSVLLHCGISDSEGKVNHFNVNLFEGDLNGWKQCISISLSDCKDWDAALKQHHKNELELLKRNPYHSIQNNCYSYCVRFLNLIQWKEKSNWTKEEFVESLVQPQLQVFETFHYIANKITKDGYFALTKPIVAGVLPSSRINIKIADH